MAVHCFTEDELRRGLAVVLDRGHRCLVCLEPHDDAHDAQAHGFHAPDVFDLFLQAARAEADPPTARDAAGVHS